MSDTEYKITMQMRSAWMVGYHVEMDELFLYFVDQDEVCWVFRHNGLDAAGFYDYMRFDNNVLLGEL